MRDVAAVSLKSDADDFGVLHHRAAAVARINLRADLNREVLIDRRMRVELEIDARDDAGRDRHAFAAKRKSVGRDDRFELRNAAELQRHHVLEKLRRRDRNEREIAIVRHELNRGRIFVRIAVAFDRQVAAVADHVGIGHDAIAIDDKTGADAARDDAGIPRRLIIRLNLGRGDADKAFLDRPVRLRRRDRDGHDCWSRRCGRIAPLAGRPGRFNQLPFVRRSGFLCRRRR